MRLLSALFVSLLSATTLAPQIADACGGPYSHVEPAPQMVLVSKDGAHSFVTLDAAQAANPIELTLVGPSGVRIVKASKQIAASPKQRRLAIDVPKRDRFVIAIPGNVEAKWTGIDRNYYTGSMKVRGTDLQIVHESRDGHAFLTVRQNGRDVGYSSGEALGVVQIKGRAFLVSQTKGYVSALELPKLALAKA